MFLKVSETQSVLEAQEIENFRWLLKKRKKELNYLLPNKHPKPNRMIATGPQPKPLRLSTPISAKAKTSPTIITSQTYHDGHGQIIFFLNKAIISPLFD